MTDGRSRSSAGSGASAARIALGADGTTCFGAATAWALADATALDAEAAGCFCAANAAAFVDCEYWDAPAAELELVKEAASSMAGSGNWSPSRGFGCAGVLVTADTSFVPPEGASPSKSPRRIVPSM